MNELKIKRITKEQMDAMLQQVKKDTAVPATPKVELQAPNADTEIISGMNDAFAMKQRLYENVLAPQLKENEELKRKLKEKLMNKLFSILKWQLIATYISVTIILVIMMFSSLLGISEQLAIESISFIKFYITSVIVELIAILFFIVKNVFDTSITDLFSNFDKNNKEKKDSQD
uniref:hypothetical protein n=1 Tax=Acetatifactor sp. TaxID=1872090 RepID=UPI00405633CD